MNYGLMIGGLIVGFLVGLTGMGGGALMTPMLVFFFRVDPLVAISSDIVVSLFMKPAGAIVHIRRKTVDWQLVKWLCVGSIPAAFAGAVFTQSLPQGAELDHLLKVFLGIALLIATAGLVLRAVHGMLQRATPLGEGPAVPTAPSGIAIKPGRTVALGAVAGLMVGITSVGAGSIIIIALLLLYPTLKASQLVGTDLVQAIPLVGAAALGHIAFGDFHFDVTGTLLIGAIPGAWLGAQVSSRAPGGIIRRALAVLLLASSLKLLGVPSLWVLWLAIGALVLGNAAWILLRRTVKVRAAADSSVTIPDDSAQASPVGAVTPDATAAGDNGQEAGAGSDDASRSGSK
ncbi:sulfite exporter TauE/SafE family protein [Rarobacter faecitabidus]|uniref:sulfite exporter TauE/SafE family protein n=1 Tax=Rarobacter faecitabidus TaxID=13243 RepID=UPI001B86ADBD|nr:sulfite exporter TauE/SafE family protein [Rarobacter faecitabidus]